MHPAGYPHANRGMLGPAQPGAFDKRPDGERGAGQINRPEVDKRGVLKTLRPRKPCQEPKNTEWLQPTVFVHRFRRESPACAIPAKLSRPDLMLCGNHTTLEKHLCGIAGLIDHVVAAPPLLSIWR